MGQLALTYRPEYTGHEAWQLQLDILRAAVTHLTPKEVLFELGIAKSTLSEALGEKNDKRWAAEWTHVIKAMLSQRYDEVSIELLQKLCEADVIVTPLTVGEPRGMTAEEERDAYRSILNQTPEGRAAVDHVQRRGKGKRR